MFGSVRLGIADRKSDVDLGVITDLGKGDIYSLYQTIWQSLEAAEIPWGNYPGAVEVCIVTLEDMEMEPLDRDLTSDHPPIAHMIRNGIPLYEKKEQQRQRFDFSIFRQG